MFPLILKLMFDFPREHNARVHRSLYIKQLPVDVNFFAERNVWLQSALRSFAIVCDYMRGNSSLCDRLPSAIRDRLRSFALIWKPALKSRA